MLTNNLLRVLPYEMGKLFHLIILGLQGNPLGKDVMNIYNDSNGTHKLLSYMLDNLSGEWCEIFCRIRSSADTHPKHEAIFVGELSMVAQGVQTKFFVHQWVCVAGNIRSGLCERSKLACNSFH